MGIENLSFLAEEAPGFAVNGSDITVLTEPTEFHHKLCALVANAKHRTVLAALYLGTGEKEKTLIENVRKSLDANDRAVKVRFLLDYCRGTRDVKGESSCTMLLPLIQQYQVQSHATSAI